MNLFGISMPTISSLKRVLPTPKRVPPTPQDAPLRPGHKTLIGMPVMSLPFILLAFVTGFHPFFVVICSLGVMVSLIGPWLLWRRYDRIGWYEQREVVRPELPFKMGNGIEERILFGEEGITFSGFLMYTLIIPYDRILSVQTECVEDCLSGVAVRFARKPYERKGYYNPNPDTKLISDCGNGERTRTVIAILRAKAPEATFAGPRWVEEGWVPRQGFTYPDSGGGGGGA